MPGRYEPYTALKVSLDAHVLTVMIDNPPLNAIEGDMHAELTTIWTVAALDPDVRCIVFTGGGDRAFSAGGSLPTMLDTWGDHGIWHAAIGEARMMIVTMLECPKPIISRINGHAMGLGASLALAGDITIMAEEGRIGDPHINVGLATGDGGALLWPHLVGTVEARRHLLSGDPLTGREAADKGLVTTAVPRAQLDEVVQKWVKNFLGKSPAAVQTTKQTLNLELVEKAKRWMDEMLRLETRSWISPNHPEAVRAVLEKREPNFANE